MYVREAEQVAIHLPRSDTNLPSKLHKKEGI